MKRQRQLKDDASVADFLILKTMNDNELTSDHELDFEYILQKYGEFIGGEELLHFISKLNMNFHNHYERLKDDDIIYLLDNGAVSEEDAADYIYSYVSSSEKLIEYFLDKGFKIEPHWVARNIYRDDLIERIKSKCQFTFDEIYESRQIYFDEDEDNHFYVDVHKHFPDPDFEDPFEEVDPYEEFEHVSTEHVEDHLHNRYWYDEENDELFAIVGGAHPNVRESSQKSFNDRQQKILIGKCKEMLKRDLQNLIDEYEEAIGAYEIANDEVSNLFKELNEIRDNDVLTKSKREMELEGT